MPRLAVVLVIAQYALASFGYGTAHLPYLIYPQLTVEQGFTNHAIFQSLLIGYIVSSLILVPVFIWFWSLVSSRTSVTSSQAEMNSRSEPAARTY